MDHGPESPESLGKTIAEKQVGAAPDLAILFAAPPIVPLRVVRK